ncbi:MAG TPA: hypothetical protein VMX38_12170 [Verrucomicrobiae bacterium]|jgi:hypothetical protein|nr:hypothetical protein [Verrucomicrobiae bacterium]
MSQPKSFLQKFFWVSVLAVLALLSVSCGSSSHTNQNISAAQAQAISQQLVTTLQGAFTALTPSLGADQPGILSLAKTLPRAVQYPQTSDCTTNSNGEDCNIPISYTGPCPNGGSIGISGDFTLMLNNSGDGSSDLSLTVMPASCAVSNLTFSGNPDITLTTDITVTDDQVQLPLTLTTQGGITYGPHPSGSCSLNVSLTVSGTESQPTCSVSGTVCGQSVSGSC